MLTRSALIALTLPAWLLLAPLATAFADGSHDADGRHPVAPVGQGRYQLIGYEPGQGVEVLDRATGTLYLVDLRARQATALEASKGTIVTRALVEEVLAAPVAGVAWPVQGPAQTKRRYEHVRGNAVMRGASTALFDSERGRLIVVTSGSRDVIDAPQGVHGRQELGAKDETGTLAKLEAGRSQRRALLVLRAIAQAEGLFRRRHAKVRFGSLAELFEAKILTKEAVEIPGYTLKVEPAKGDLAQRRFLARAVPTKAGMGHFAINESGVVHGSNQAIPASEDASLPAHARPIQAAPKRAPARRGAPQEGRTQPGFSPR